MLQGRLEPAVQTVGGRPAESISVQSRAFFYEGIKDWVQYWEKGLKSGVITNKKKYFVLVIIHKTELKNKKCKNFLKIAHRMFPLPT
jgi:hypothetical protein